MTISDGGGFFGLSSMPNVASFSQCAMCMDFQKTIKATCIVFKWRWGLLTSNVTLVRHKANMVHSPAGELELEKNPAQLFLRAP